MKPCMACGGEAKYVMGSPYPRRFGGPWLCHDCEFANTTCQHCYGWDLRHLSYCPFYEEGERESLDKEYLAKKYGGRKVFENKEEK